MESISDQIKEVKKIFEIPDDATDSQTMIILLKEVCYHLTDALNCLISIRNNI
jgi:hypothetical protein